MLLQDLKLTFGAGYINSSFTFQGRVCFIFTLSSSTNKRPELLLITFKILVCLLYNIIPHASFFSITNCFTSLRNLQYSVHNLLSPLCQNLLYTSRLCLILPLISSSHHLVDLPQTTVFSPITILATFVTRFSHALSTS